MTPPLWYFCLPFVLYALFIVVKRYIAKNRPVQEYEPSWWDERYKLKAAAKRRMHSWLTNLPLIRRYMYQPVIELHAHPVHHVIRYGLMPDGTWLDFGSTIDVNLEQSKQEYLAALRLSGFRWFRPALVLGYDSAPLPPAWEAMKEWDRKRLDILERMKAPAGLRKKVRRWISKADLSIAKGEYFMSRDIFQRRLQGREWAQFCSQPD